MRININNVKSSESIMANCKACGAEIEDNASLICKACVKKNTRSLFRLLGLILLIIAVGIGYLVNSANWTGEGAAVAAGSLDVVALVVGIGGIVFLVIALKAR